MSIDDELMPWPAAEAIERGRDPQRPDNAQFRLARLLAEHDDVLTIHKYMLIAGRVLAFLPRINAWSDAENKPTPGKQLRQQQTASQSDEDFFLEQAHYHLGGYRDAMAALSKMGSVYAAEYDPDARDQDAEDRREAEQRHDDRAAQNAPDVRAS